MTSFLRSGATLLLTPDPDWDWVGWDGVMSITGSTNAMLTKGRLLNFARNNLIPALRTYLGIIQPIANPEFYKDLSYSAIHINESNADVGRLAALEHLKKYDDHSLGFVVHEAVASVAFLHNFGSSDIASHYKTLDHLLSQPVSPENIKLLAEGETKYWKQQEGISHQMGTAFSATDREMYLTYTAREKGLFPSAVNTHLQLNGKNTILDMHVPYFKYDYLPHSYKAKAFADLPGIIDTVNFTVDRPTLSKLVKIDNAIPLLLSTTGKFSATFSDPSKKTVPSGVTPDTMPVKSGTWKIVTPNQDIFFESKHVSQGKAKPAKISSERVEFYGQVGGAVTKALHDNGIKNEAKARYILSQYRLENSFNLTPPNNNPFNIKGSGDIGSKPFYTHEFEDGKSVGQVASFANFSSLEAGMKGYLATLKSNFPEAYKALEDDDKTIDDFTAGLQKGTKGSYATDPEYSAKLSDILDGINNDYKKMD